MQRLARTAVIASVASFASLGTATPSLADVVITIDKSSQRMSVTVDGARRYNWPYPPAPAGPPSGVHRQAVRHWIGVKPCR